MRLDLVFTWKLWGSYDCSFTGELTGFEGSSCLSRSQSMVKCMWLWMWLLFLLSNEIMYNKYSNVVVTEPKRWMWIMLLEFFNDVCKFKFQHTPFALKTGITNKTQRGEANEKSASPKIRKTFIWTRTGSNTSRLLIWGQKTVMRWEQYQAHYVKYEADLDR